MTPKDILEKYLKVIDWSLIHHGGEHYSLCDHKGNETNITFWDNAIEYKEANVICSFKITEKLMFISKEKDFISIGTRNHFILLMNHDRR